MIIIKSKKRSNLSLNKKERQIEGTKIWVSYYRQNIARFATDFLGVKLKPFQHILLHEFHQNSNSVFIASRGLGKSWLTAVYVVCYAILYPGAKIVISTETKSQSQRLIREKIVNDLYYNCPNLRRELRERDIKIGSNESYVKFLNGSVITALNASQNTRGARCNVLLVDEFVQLRGGTDTLKSILEPFLQVPRLPGYTSKPQYANIYEENKELLLSSAWWADHWSYELYEGYVEKMLQNEGHFACNLPYTVAVKYGLMTQKRVEQVLDDPSMTDEQFQMEYNANFVHLNDGTYIKPSDITPNRTVVNAWYPPTSIQYAEEKNNRKKSWEIPKTTNKELRVIGCDVAFANSSNGKNNDNTIIHYAECIPKDDKYMIEIKYSEAMNGNTASLIALRLKRLFYDGLCDYIVLDVLGSGLAVLDILCEYTYDEERDIKYPPMKCFNLKDKEERCKYKEAVPCIYGIVADEKLNNEIAVTLKSSLQNHTLRFLVNEFDAEDYLYDHKDFAFKSNEEKVSLLYPYIQTTLMQTEIIKLRTELTRYGIKLKEYGTNTKDRYSALAYLNKFIREKEGELKKKKTQSYFCAWD